MSALKALNSHNLQYSKGEKFQYYRTLYSENKKSTIIQKGAFFE